MEGLEQWKLFVDLLCHCDEIIETRAKFFENFLRVLYYQLNQLPKDWFKDEIKTIFVGSESNHMDKSEYENRLEREKSLLGYVRFNIACQHTGINLWYWRYRRKLNMQGSQV